MESISNEEIEELINKIQWLEKENKLLKEQIELLVELKNLKDQQPPITISYPAVERIPINPNPYVYPNVVYCDATKLTLNTNKGDA